MKWQLQLLQAFPKGITLIGYMSSSTAELILKAEDEK